MLRRVRTVTDAPPSRDALADWGIAAAGSICILCRVSTSMPMGGGRKGTHSGVGTSPDVLLGVTFAVVDVRCSVGVEHSRGSAGLQRLRAHAMGEEERAHQSSVPVVTRRGGEDMGSYGVVLVRS
jgi:hypothetical protein